MGLSLVGPVSAVPEELARSRRHGHHPRTLITNLVPVNHTDEPPDLRVDVVRYCPSHRNVLAYVRVAGGVVGVGGQHTCVPCNVPGPLLGAYEQAMSLLPALPGSRHNGRAAVVEKGAGSASKYYH